MTDSSDLTICLVEDDSEIRMLVADLLIKEGWNVLQAEDGQKLDEILRARSPDLLILDINLPGESGLSICKRVSAETDMAILMLTARSEDVDRIIGLEIGADDYLGKPFNPRELTARVRALLRRIQKQKKAAFSETDCMNVSGYRIDPNARTVKRDDGHKIKLSGAEFDLFLVLAEAKGRVLSRDFLLDRIHGRSAHAYDRSIDVLVSRLRKKIDRGMPSLIESVRNAGYVLRDTPE